MQMYSHGMLFWFSPNSYSSNVRDMHETPFSLFLKFSLTYHISISQWISEPVSSLQSARPSHQHNQVP